MTLIEMNQIQWAKDLYTRLYGPTYIGGKRDEWDDKHWLKYYIRHTNYTNTNKQTVIK